MPSRLGNAPSTPTAVPLRWLALCALAAAGWACGAAGMPPRPAPAPSDARVRHVEAPTEQLEQAALAQLPGVASDRVEVAVAFPDGFDASRAHPILITQVTADSFRPNVDELSAYAPTALEQGYVVLTAQVIPWVDGGQSDTLMLRYVALRAALRWLAREAPGSMTWPLVLAGFSGGSKISQALAFSLMLDQRSVAGVFLGGCNEAHSEELLGEYPRLRPSFAQIAFFLSAGKEDRIAPLSSARSVAEELRGSGVEHLELSTYRGGHRLDPEELAKALRWFKTYFPQAKPG